MSGPEVITFGCRVNAYESEVIRARAGEAGLGNAVIFNTCAVTSEAVRQSRQSIRSHRRANPDARPRPIPTIHWGWFWPRPRLSDFSPVICHAG